MQKKSGKLTAFLTFLDDFNSPSGSVFLFLIYFSKIMVAFYENVGDKQRGVKSPSVVRPFLRRRLKIIEMMNLFNCLYWLYERCVNYLHILKGKYY